MTPLIPNSSTLSDFFYDISRFTLRFASVLLLTYVLAVLISLILTWRPGRRGSTRVAVLLEVNQPQREQVDSASEASGTGGGKAIEPTPIQVMYIRRVSDTGSSDLNPKKTYVNGESPKEAQK
ncbi:hypothetical protein NYP18_06345 [Corynebacterium sp. YIM 101645]|uniref:Secreted protein n=1 Tax=Corynebacterium lemuris TaxID=1859292 RepID=A0ABT2FVK7_9CORY|nr:hypothetical protein [Corynebacterium lemuris]MCS5479273.1 hypothetical protein [Corynebacterium lemuris]